MVYLNGINLVADTEGELHKFAYSVGLYKTWYRGEDKCYDVINPLIVDRIINKMDKENRKLKKQ